MAEGGGVAGVNELVWHLVSEFKLEEAKMKPLLFGNLKTDFMSLSWTVFAAKSL